MRSKLKDGRLFQRVTSKIKQVVTMTANAAVRSMRKSLPQDTGALIRTLRLSTLEVDTFAGTVKQSILVGDTGPDSLPTDKNVNYAILLEIKTKFFSNEIPVVKSLLRKYATKYIA